MTIAAKVVKDSVGDSSPRLTTLLLRFPHIILPQVLTHRMLSRSTQSSRAIPFVRLLKSVLADPFFPKEWRYKADRGMQPGELMSEEDANDAEDEWVGAYSSALLFAERLDTVGAAKEHINRLLEPFSHVNMVVTATDWDNFFELRLDEHSQIEIRELAKAMKEAMDNSKPTHLTNGQWHTPFVDQYVAGAELLSAARCARTSYLTHEGQEPNVAADLTLAHVLKREKHMSPFEHVAMSGWGNGDHSGNFQQNWVQYRKLIEIGHR